MNNKDLDMSRRNVTEIIKEITDKLERIDTKGELITCCCRLREIQYMYDTLYETLRWHKETKTASTHSQSVLTEGD